MFEPTLSQADAEDEDKLSDLSHIPDNSDKDILTAELLLPNTNTASPVQWQSICQKPQLTPDYRKINQGCAANVKFHASVSYNSPHLRPIRDLFQYALTKVPTQDFQWFDRVARKKKRPTPDLLSYKRAMQINKADK